DLLSFGISNDYPGKSGLQSFIKSKGNFVRRCLDGAINGRDCGQEFRMSKRHCDSDEDGRNKGGHEGYWLSSHDLDPSLVGSEPLCVRHLMQFKRQAYSPLLELSDGELSVYAFSIEPHLVTRLDPVQKARRLGSENHRHAFIHTKLLDGTML